MYAAKFKQLIVSGKLSLVIRIVFISLVLASSLISGTDVMATLGPAPGGIGG